MAKRNRTHQGGGRGVPSATAPDATAADAFKGHPSFRQLMAEQGTGTITDISALHGDFWPEEESVEEFLETLYEWRGRKRIDPAA